MGNQISINNFKKISSVGIKIDNFERVNYLVGENGAGKSSILDALMSLNESGQIHAELTNKSLYRGNGKIELDLGNDKYISPSIQWLYNLKVIRIQGSLGMQTNTKIVNGFHQNIDFSNISMGINTNEIIDFIIETLNEIKNVDGESIYTCDRGLNDCIKINGDEIEIWKLSFGIQMYIKIKRCIKKNKALEPGNNTQELLIITVEEPETYLHPGLQKEIPRLIDDLKKENPNIYFFISTHSPFIISASAEFKDTKVYFIEDGQTIDFSGNGGGKRTGKQSDGYIAGSNGYAAKASVSIAAKMLGAGFGDLLNKDQELHKTNTIILCESSNVEIDQMDETYYNIIFKERVNVFRFVSCGSCGDVIAKSQFMDELKTTTKYIGLIDKDKNHEELKRIIPNLRVLKRYSIESYLYDPCIIEKLEGLQNFDLEQYKKEYNSSNIKEDNIRHTKSSQIKEFIRKNYCLNQKIFFTNKTLAEIIYNNKSEIGIKEIYQELEESIFDK